MPDNKIDIGFAKRFGDRLFQRRPWRISGASANRFRFAVQLGFLLLCLWIGLEFHLFVKYLESGGTVGSSFRPPGVEGFLPISSLMAVYLFVLTGEIHPAHPAGFFILLAILLVSLVFSKSFCSWICPIGLLSESLHNLGQRLIGRRLRLPRIIDSILRSLKYFLLAFFIYSIFFLMNSQSLKAFLDGPYNLVADIKMYYFFAHISRLTIYVLAGLILLSVFIPNFWCRYLCPYGALLGALSLGGAAKVRRDESLCIDCALCAEACPSMIKVHKRKTVVSDECTSCLSCTDACPVDGALEYGFAGKNHRLNPRIVALTLVGLFVAVTGLAMILGRWHNRIPLEDYFRHIKHIESYDHPR